MGRVEDLEPEGLATPDGEQLPDKLAGTQHRVADAGCIRRAWVVGGQVGLDQIRVPRDGGEHVVHVVGHRPGEPTDELGTLGAEAA